MNRKTLLIGIGQIGCAVADAFARTTRPEDGPVHVLAIDTDARTADTMTASPIVTMASPCKISDVLDEVDTDLVKQWFPCDRENDCIEYFETMSVNEGANQWRMKALLSFYHFLSKPKNLKLLEKHLLPVADPECTDLRIHLVASLAGGTGSGLFLPLAIYLKNYFRAHANIQNIDVNALLTLPDFCEDLLTAEQQIKSRANAYAALREVNAITRLSLGKEEPFRFRIGDPKDTVLGLLYDAEDPAFQTPESVPFRQVHLFRRMPGIRSITSQVSFLADAARSLCAEQPLPLNTTDALYGGVSLTKTIYPHADILSYISKATLCDAAPQWIHLYDTAEGLRKHLPSAELESEITADKNPQNIANAVLAAVEALRPEKESSYSLLLNRIYKEPEDNDDAPEQLLPGNFIPLVEEEICRALRNEDAFELEEFLRKHKKSTNKDKKKKKKEPRMSSKDRKKEMHHLSVLCGNALRNYFLFGTKQIPLLVERSRILYDPTSEISLRKLLQDKEHTLHPAYALARLSTLYTELSEVLMERDDRADSFRVENPEEHLPLWLFAADDSVHTDSRYSQAGADRFFRILTGDHSHVGGKETDKILFCYDVEVAYNRIFRALRHAYLTELIKRIGEWITEYKIFFDALKKTLSDRDSELITALHRSAGRSSSVYYVRATADEKRHLYKQFRAEIEETDLPRELQDYLDAALGEGILSLVEARREESLNPQEETDRLLQTLYGHVHTRCIDTPFCRTAESKDILETILHQDGQDGSDPADLALSRAFASSTEPLIYVIPNTNNPYSLSRNIRRTVTAYLPETARQYLETHRADFGDAQPQQILDQLLFRAGEYEEEVRFTNTLPPNEMRVLRKTEGLELAFLEILSETSGDPLCYKAYRKALHMEWEQNTALWNPHLICGLSDESLPPISRQ